MNRSLLTRFTHTNNDNVDLVSRNAFSASLTASTLNNNSADNGGAIFNHDLASLSLQNSTLSANTVSVTPKRDRSSWGR